MESYQLQDLDDEEIDSAPEKVPTEDDHDIKPDPKEDDDDD